MHLLAPCLSSLQWSQGPTSRTHSRSPRHAMQGKSKHTIAISFLRALAGSRGSSARLLIAIMTKKRRKGCTKKSQRSASRIFAVWSLTALLNTQTIQDMTDWIAIRWNVIIVIVFPVIKGTLYKDNFVFGQPSKHHVARQSGTTETPRLFQPVHQSLSESNHDLSPHVNLSQEGIASARLHLHQCL